VIDGDTFILSTGERVRLLMVDAPEWGSRRQDCYGKEAAAFMQSLLVNQNIVLHFDEVTIDVYGRTLAYVEIAGRDVSTLVLERGYGKIMYIPPNGKRRYSALKKIEQQAKAERRGLWDRCF
jgi:micrococcal nuclease